MNYMQTSNAVLCIYIYIHIYNYIYIHNSYMICKKLIVLYESHAKVRGTPPSDARKGEGSDSLQGSDWWNSLCGMDGFFHDMN